MKKVICIGSASKDIFFPTNEGVIMETPEELTSKRKIAFELGAKYQIEDRFEAPGGCAANVAQGLARLGIAAACYSKLGDDAVGRWIEEELAKEGVDVELLQKERSCKSDLSAIIVDTASGERTIFFNRDANERLEILPEQLTGADTFFISALNGAWEDHLAKILELVKEKKIQFIINPGQRNIKDNVNAVIEGVRASEVFISNKDEAIEIVAGSQQDLAPDQLDDEMVLIKELAKMGPRTVVITDGERGAWGTDSEAYFFAEPLLKKAVDSTGAGDALTSGFLAAYLAGKKMEEALSWGIANSSNSVIFYGAREGLLKTGEIEDVAAKVTVKKIA